ncbi:hypothetical protein MC7420_620 [Coleofasciculus chthonoplastes PCC 7420]|uniref:Uncharacterized protein n=1 Tax=Coleofasciculus chthonoplastes PCC 7420 TaxID=118168 RepID=B4VLI5_9CYAN|nr:hypothetical protein [Coleofasciculus chthonoplastes]EDX77483.1 hypothetical protein MC7420_620 [Coleofasciculus chthonoplastes PCC 7420]
MSFIKDSTSQFCSDGHWSLVIGHWSLVIGQSSTTFNLYFLQVVETIAYCLFPIPSPHHKT